MSGERIAAVIARIRDEHRTANSFYVPVRRCDYYRCTCGHIMRWADEHADHYDAELAAAIQSEITAEFQRRYRQGAADNSWHMP